MGKTKDQQIPAVSIADLIRDQGIHSITDLDELGNLWPQGDDPDLFLAFIDAERCSRRYGGRAASVGRALPARPKGI